VNFFAKRGLAPGIKEPLHATAWPIGWATF